MPNAIDLKNRFAVVTGGAQGIGRAAAERFVASGAKVAIWDHDTKLAEKTASEIGPAVKAYACDVTNLAAIEKARDATLKDFGRIDILVNNAGIVNNIARIAQMTPEAWDHELRVNLSGMFHTVRAFVPAMAERGWGRVVNIASVAAEQPGLGQPAYTASKAGVVAFTRAVAQEFGPRGVTANAIEPGLIATPLVRSMPEHLQERYRRITPVGRLGQPADIGNLAAFLASPAAGFISAVAIPCDGGALHAPVAGLDG